MEYADFKERVMKFSNSIAYLQHLLDKPGRAADDYVYVEVGPCKPWSTSVVRAAIRRGYRVEKYCGGRVYYVYPKAPAMPSDEQLLAALGPCGK